MKMPGFSAEVSLYQTRERHYRVSIFGQADRAIRPAALPGDIDPNCYSDCTTGCLIDCVDRTGKKLTRCIVRCDLECRFQCRVQPAPL